MEYFCTYFDINYLSRGLVLYDSLLKHVDDFRLFILCHDEETFVTLKQLDREKIIPINIKDFEMNDFQLKQAKNNRSKIEYYFTCTPSLPLYILKNNLAIESIAYLDADLYFFDSYDTVKTEVGNASIAIIPHHFPFGNEDKLQFGKFNVGYIFFRNDFHGLRCLEEWRSNCIKWCYDKVENGKFADQKYLDQWPNDYENLKIINHKGMNLAPWNIKQYNIVQRDGKIQVDLDNLVFVHFHAFRKIKNRFYEPGLHGYGVQLTNVMREYIYRPYVQNLTEIEKTLRKNFSAIDSNIGRAKQIYSNFQFLIHWIRRRFIFV